MSRPRTWAARVRKQARRRERKERQALADARPRFTALEEVFLYGFGDGQPVGIMSGLDTGTGPDRTGYAVAPPQPPI